MIFGEKGALKGVRRRLPSEPEAIYSWCVLYARSRLGNCDFGRIVIRRDQYPQMLIEPPERVADGPLCSWSEFHAWLQSRNPLIALEPARSDSPAAFRSIVVELGPDAIEVVRWRVPELSK